MSTAEVAQHLPSFQRLTFNIYLHEPPLLNNNNNTTASSPAPPEAPALVILFTWGGAPLRALAKYATHYTKLFPSARILVLRTAFNEFFYQRVPGWLPAISPAVSAVQSTASQQGRNARVLAHVFSNGGCFKLERLAMAYKQASGTQIPLDALIFDSAPGIGHLWRSMKAFTYVLPRQVVLYWVFYGLTLSYLVIWRVFCFIFKSGGDWTRRVFDRLNDGTLLPAKPRLYVYAETDELVDSRDIQEHVRVARQSLAGVEEKEFRGSGHVAHMQKYPEEYWSTVMGFWQRSIAQA